MTNSRHLVSRARAGCAGGVVVLASVVAPAAGAADPAPPPPADGHGASTDVAAGEDVMRATAADVAGSLADARAEVDEQVDALRAARRIAATAEAAADDADAAVKATQDRIAELVDETDQAVVDAFVNPPEETAMETLATETVVGSTVRQSLLDEEADRNAALLDELDAARAELDEKQQAQEEAAADAEAKAAAADAALADLVDAQSRQTLFVMAVEDRLAADQVEAASVAELDPAAAAALRARADEIGALIDEIVSERQRRAQLAALADAMAAAAARADAETAPSAASTSSSPSSPPPPPSSITSASGGLATVSCPGGGSITVAGSIAGNLRAMLDAAAAAGSRLCGNGYRDPAQQIEVRKSNCGTSYYAIYEAPSSACSPPTAPPGTSAHEQGLAIDFTCNGGGVLSTGTSCYQWLTANAAGYGFYNLPSEPWHWSTDGT